MRQEDGRLENAQVLGASRVEFCMMACVPLIPLLPNYAKLVTMWFRFLVRQKRRFVSAIWQC
jgi:hypothetical protein